MQQVLTNLKNQLLTPNFLVEASKLVISRYLVLTDTVLSEWEDDPEAFVLEEDSDAWEFNLRACGEKLLSVLVSKNRALLGPFLVDTLKSLPAGLSSHIKSNRRLV